MGVRKMDSGVCLITEQGMLGFWAPGENTLRCVLTKKENFEHHSLMVRPELYASGLALDVEETDEKVRVRNHGVEAVIDKKTGLICWQNRLTGEIMCHEQGKNLEKTDVIHYTTNGQPPVVRRVKTVDGERSFIENLKPQKDRTAYRASINFAWEDGESLHGLGQGEDGIYDYRNHKQYLYQHNMRTPMPVLVSDKGYSILFDCCSLMTFEDNEDGGCMTLDTVEQLEYYITVGTCTDDLIHAYRKLTGKAAMLPKWAFGYIQSKEAYRTAEELLEIGEEYRRRGLPLDCVVQDWNTWEPGKWGNKKLDVTRYGNIKEVNEKLHQKNIHTMVSVWPNMAEEGENHREFTEKGFILGDYSTYDAFSADARELYWKQANEELFACGFDSWWCDSTEPFSGPDWGGEEKREEEERFRLVGGEHKKYLDAADANAYGLIHAKGIYENQRKQCPGKRVLNLTRSGYASQQKYGAVLWSGDILASWETLKRQIHEGLNMCMSGMPYWTLDIGGFFTVGSKWQNRGCNCNDNSNPLWFWKGKYNDGVKDLGYCELYTRWLEFGAFLPIFRSHGTDTPREIWQFGEPGSMFYDAIEKYIRLRYHLMPYVYSLAGRTMLKDETMMRSLCFDFAEDVTAKKLGDEYMFGDSLLICPVTEPMYYEAESKPLNREKTWNCYLPAGTGWYHYWTNRYYEGGQWVEVPAPLDEMPIFVKAGAILPMIEEETRYASQSLGSPLVLRVYPGADGVFELYEDGGEDYSYENGNYALTKLWWNEKEQKLTVGERSGSFAGGDLEKGYKVEVVKTV